MMTANLHPRDLVGAVPLAPPPWLPTAAATSPRSRLLRAILVMLIGGTGLVIGCVIGLVGAISLDLIQLC